MPSRLRRSGGWITSFLEIVRPTPRRSTVWCDGGRRRTLEIDLVLTVWECLHVLSSFERTGCGFFDIEREARPLWETAGAGRSLRGL
jgi:hypothetical protein